MMANDWQRLSIWLVMANRFDYTEFETACRTSGIEPQEPLEFAQKAGMITCGMVAFPELPAPEAYLKFLQAVPSTPAPPPFVPQVAPQEQSKGLGDSVAKFTHATGLDKLSEAYTAITGKDCGCASRQEALNKLLPYSQG
jgi:hypothetical protein